MRPDFPPEYLPVDEAHPMKPAHAYGVSKLVVEDIARGFANRCASREGAPGVAGDDNVGGGGGGSRYVGLPRETRRPQPSPRKPPPVSRSSPAGGGGPPTPAAL